MGGALVHRFVLGEKEVSGRERRGAGGIGTSAAVYALWSRAFWS